MINVIQVEEFEKFTNSLNNIASAIENMPASSGIDYSTEEQDTGLKWIDEKNIYQRSFDLSNTTFSKNTWNSNILGTTGSGIYIIDVWGYWKVQGYNTKIPLVYYYNNTSRSTYTTSTICDDIDFWVADSGSNSVIGDVITIQYTKS